MAGWASKGLAAAPLSDLRIQLWVTDSSGAIWSTWQTRLLIWIFGWVYWQKPWTEALPPFSAQQVAAAPLSDNSLQFWAVDTAGRIWSSWQSSPKSNAPWTAWTSSWTPSPPPFQAVQVAAAPLSDDRLHFWAVDTTGAIWSCWKSTADSNAPWTAWRSRWTPSPPPFQAVQVAAAPLSDGRLQIWAVDTTGAIWSCWKSTADSNAPWTAWTSSWTPSPPPFQAVQVAGAPLSDGRLQIWAVDTTGAIWSCWQSTVDSNAPWTAWTTAWIADIPAFQTQVFSAARFSDGRMSVWAIDTEGQIRTAAKTSFDFNSAWSNWALVFNMQQQEQTDWCWAGCAVGTSHFYDPSSAWTQCTLANAAFKKTTCCQDRGACNRPWKFIEALTTVGNLDSPANGIEAQATITAEVKSGEPLGVRVDWRGGTIGHVLMVVGGGANDMVTVQDPFYGQWYIPYSTLVNSYMGTGSWTRSFFTKP